MTKEKVKNFVQNKKAAIATGIVALNAFWVTGTAFGAPDGKVNDLTKAFQDIATKFYDLVRSIANPIAVVALAVCLLTLFFSKNKNTSQEAYSWCKTIIIAFFAINLLALIVNWLTGNFFNSFGTDFNWTGA